MVDGITKGVLVSLCCDTAKAKVGITVEQVVVFFATLVYNPYCVCTSELKCTTRRSHKLPFFIAFRCFFFFFFFFFLKIRVTSLNPTPPPPPPRQKWQSVGVEYIVHNNNYVREIMAAYLAAKAHNYT